MCTENVEVAILYLEALIYAGNAAKGIEPSKDCIAKWFYNNDINH